jgi:tetratricopeptide (TPR) repeat protein
VLAALRAAREEQYGPTSARALEAWMDLGRFLVADRRPQEALELLEGVQGRLSAALPAGHEVSLAHMDLLSRLRATTGDHRAAGLLVRRLIEILERTGKPFAALASGELHQRLGESELRHRLQEAAIESFRKAAARADEPTARATALLGAARSHVEIGMRYYDLLEEFLVADELIGRALGEGAGALPPELWADLLYEQAFARTMAGLWAEGLEACEGALAMDPPVLSPDERLQLEETRALCLEQLDRVEEARTLQMELLERLAAERGPWDDLRLSVLRRTCTFLAAHGRLEAAAALLDRWRVEVRDEPPVTMEQMLWSALFETYATELISLDESREARWDCVRGWRNLLHVGPEPSYVNACLTQALVLAREGVTETAPLGTAHSQLIGVSFALYLHRSFDRLESALRLRDVQQRQAGIDTTR